MMIILFSVKCYIFTYDMRKYLDMYIIYISNTLCNIISFRISMSVCATRPHPCPPPSQIDRCTFLTSFRIISIYLILKPIKSGL